MQRKSGCSVVMIGGGPAGLTAAYQLCNANVDSIVLEKDGTVGGLSRTIRHKGYSFDIGGHRFYTKVKAVDDMWREVLPNGDFLRRKRLSRIYYNRRFFSYPLRFSSALNLGLWNGSLILLSYLRARVSPELPEQTFEQWISNRFGKRLYRTFFKTYTEKVWGIPCSEITADWAAQRIKGLSLFTALRNIVFTNSKRHKESVRSLIEEFDYPRLGPGMMWEAVARRVESKGAQVRLGAAVEKILWKHDRVDAVEISIDGRRELISGTHFISSMPIRELIGKLDPVSPPEVREAAEGLHYRDFITVVLIVNKRELFPDNWIYIHDPEVRLGRIQNFKNWSPHMVPDQEKTCLGLEYFCFAGDGLWTATDEELVDRGKRELETLGLCNAIDIEEGIVVRVPKAYPVYDSTYKQALGLIRDFLRPLSNLQLVGRNGMHKYNNQDHSMLTAMLAVENILGGNFDLWEVNADREYLEEMSKRGVDEFKKINQLSSTQPSVPHRVRSPLAASFEPES